MCNLVLKHHVYNGILHNLREYLELRQLSVVAYGTHYGVASNTHTALYREHRWRNMSFLYIVKEEIYHMVAYSFGLGCYSLERACFLWNTAFYHAYKFGRVKFEILLTNASAHCQQWYWLAIWIFGTLVLVVQIAYTWVMKGV